MTTEVPLIKYILETTKVPLIKHILETSLSAYQSFKDENNNLQVIISYTFKGKNDAFLLTFPKVPSFANNPKQKTHEANLEVESMTKF